MHYSKVTCYACNSSPVSINTGDFKCLACMIQKTGLEYLKCRSRDPDHAHFVVVCHPKANIWPILPVYKIWRLYLLLFQGYGWWVVTPELKTVHMTWPCHFHGSSDGYDLLLSIYRPHFEVHISTQYEDIKNYKMWKMGRFVIVSGHWK